MRLFSSKALYKMLDQRPVYRLSREVVEEVFGNCVVAGSFRLQVTPDKNSSSSTYNTNDIGGDLLSRLDRTYKGPEREQGQYHWWCYLPRRDLPGIEVLPAGKTETRWPLVLVILVVCVPPIFFVTMSYQGINRILEQIDNAESMVTGGVLGYLRTHELESAELTVKTHLELDTLRNRQLRANAALTARTWLRFMSSLFGSILVLIGSVFILSKIEFGKPTSMEAGSQTTKFSIQSTSPGIIMVVIGAALMVVPNISKQNIDARDGSVYFWKENGNDTSSDNTGENLWEKDH